MFKKLYPSDQIEKYLLIDVIMIVFLIYRVFSMDGPFPPVGKIGFILLFLGSLYVCLWYRHWLLLMGCLAGCSLIVVLGAYGESWLLLYGFVYADLLGRARRKVITGMGMAGLAGMFVLVGWLQEGHPTAIFQTFYFPIMIIQLALPLIIQVWERNKVLKEKLNLANVRLERYIQEEERTRIARDLHDTLGQTLTMIKMKSELTIRLVEQSPDKAKNELIDIVNTSRHALQQVRELVTGMKFVSLEKEIGLSAQLLQKAGTRLNATSRTSLTPLSPVAETMLALCVREAVTNVIKHSGASQCTIDRYEQNQRYYIEVSDDGNGRLEQGKGHGVHSFQERMAMLQGEVDLRPRPGEGTTITFAIPLMGNRGEVR